MKKVYGGGELNVATLLQLRSADALWKSSKVPSSLKSLEGAAFAEALLVACGVARELFRVTEERIFVGSALLPCLHAMEEGGKEAVAEAALKVRAIARLVSSS